MSKGGKQVSQQATMLVSLGAFTPTSARITSQHDFVA
jgi:hypothetical protein